MQSVLPDQGPAGDPGVVARHARPHRQHAAPARNLSRLLGADRSQSARRSRADDGQVGDALAKICVDRQEFRSRRHERSQRRFSPLAALAFDRAPLRGAFTSFSENAHVPDGTRPPVWFALDETRPLAFFAGIWTPWTSVRKVKEGKTTNALFAFLTTEPNKVVGLIHPKAMPAILTTQRGGPP